VAALAAVDLGNLLQLVLEPSLDELRVGADPLQERNHEPILLREQAREDVLGEDFLMVAATSYRLRLLERLLRLDRELVDFHGANVTQRRIVARHVPFVCWR